MTFLRNFAHSLDRYAVYPESLFALTLLLFVLSLALPVVATDPIAHKYANVCVANYGSPNAPGCSFGVVSQTYFGFLLLIIGWMQLGSFQIASFAWLANPVLLIALVLAKRGVARDATITAAIAVFLGLLLLDFASFTLPVNDESFAFAHVSLGYFPWEASLIVALLYCRALLSAQTYRR